MGVRVLFDRDERAAVIYDSVTGTAFGPLFSDDDERCLDAGEVAFGFLAFAAEVADADPRVVTERQLRDLVSRWDSARAEIGTTTADRETVVELAVAYDKSARVGTVQ